MSLITALKERGLLTGHGTGKERLDKLLRQKREVDPFMDCGLAASQQTKAIENKYAWMVASNLISGETSSSLGKMGPTGATWQPTVKTMLAEGEQFRLLSAAGEVCFAGYIIGEYTGREPLEDFGKQKGCVTSEIERGGCWVPIVE